LTRVLQQLRPDVVHTHSSKAGIVGRLAAARAGVPLIVHTIHGMSFNRTQAWATQRLYRFLERRAARVTTAFVSVADAMTEQAVAAGLADRERFATVYSGMETERFGPRPELRERNRRQWGIGPDEVVAGTIARLFSHKGYEEIIAAMPRAVAAEPRLRFVWIGGGPHQERYRKRLEAMGLSDRVQMVGLIPPEEVPSHLNGLDMLVHASQWEGLPRTVVQALLTEIPALSFANDGAPEVVVPGETGLLVPLGDTDGLARAMVTLAGDPDLRRRLGSAGRRRCLAMFDWRTMVEKIEAIYRGLQPLPAERRGDGAP
jgi:glycosyltransferase involved in cell wall biosynthesis